MQLVVDIKNQNLADKIIKLLKIFEQDGVTINYSKEKPNRHSEKTEEIEDWQKELMMHENPDIEDDDVLPEAYMEYYSEKYSS